jgi:hypothetical protein
MLMRVLIVNRHQERLRHDDISMTVHVYAKGLPENKRTALYSIVTFYERRLKNHELSHIK